VANAHKQFQVDPSNHSQVNWRKAKPGAKFTKHS
jgi:hypothetical protein